MRHKSVLKKKKNLQKFMTIKESLQGRKGERERETEQERELLNVNDERQTNITPL